MRGCLPAFASVERSPGTASSLRLERAADHGSLREKGLGAVSRRRRKRRTRGIPVVPADRLASDDGSCRLFGSMPATLFSIPPLPFRPRPTPTAPVRKSCGVPVPPVGIPPAQPPSREPGEAGTLPLAGATAGRRWGRGAPQTRNAAIRGKAMTRSRTTSIVAANGAAPQKTSSTFTRSSPRLL